MDNNVLQYEKMNQVVNAKGLSLMGLLIGFVFLMSAWMYDILHLDYELNFSGLNLIHTNNPVHWIIDAVPVIFGLMGFFIGYYIDRYRVTVALLISAQESSLKKVVDFTDKIGQGDYNVTFESVNKDDDLGRVLNKMRNNLSNFMKVEEEQRWIVEGRTAVSILLSDQSDPVELGYQVVKQLAVTVSALQGAFYILNRDGAEPVLEMAGRYAYNRRKYEMSNFKIGEGLVGQCAFEMQTIHRTEISDEFMSITSGLITDKKPNSIILIPLITDNKLYGVVELASLGEFSNTAIKFLEQTSDNIARSLFNIQVNSTTKVLLDESQNLTKKLEFQIQEVEIQQHRVHSLLENSSEIIAIYDEHGTITYESPSIKNILGITPEEMVGQNVFESADTDSIIMIRELFSFSLENEDEIKTVEIPYKNAAGEDIWLEAMAKNLIENQSIKGIVFNFRDVTGKRKAEKEQIMRAKMQSLSENSQDIIIRLGLEGEVQYVNPMLRKYTGINTWGVIGQSVNEIGLEDQISGNWLLILDEVVKSKQLIVKEMGFPTEGEDLFMQINAIPEFDDNKVIESILFVANDITERKIQEAIIKKTNKKITDSINYAKRIQHAIIPRIEDIRKDIPNTSMFYKPKDVVSGDFPYYLKKNGYIYYAAVDCTGHGVPGAMMSLIGHLILNDILDSDEPIEPGEVLYKLHKGVVRTLKQEDPEHGSADGMDVALCRIKEDLSEVLYSGAHRPLYHLQKGELIQYKGDSFPIGGNQYGGKNNFVSHEVSIQKGDSLYFFSDGYPDQFGGPKMLKYGPKRIRNSIVENAGIPVNEMVVEFEKSYADWLKDGKQIDDVLLIGIDF